VKTESFIGFRYLWNTRRTRFLSVITIICVLGIAIGVSALIIVQSVMDGLQNRMKMTILGARTHITVQSEEEDFSNHLEVAESLRKIKGIKGVTPLVKREVIISSDNEMTGAVLNGVDFRTADSVLLFPGQIQKGSIGCIKDPETCPEIIKRLSTNPMNLFKDGMNDVNKGKLKGIAIGSELSNYFGLEIGDVLKIISPVGGGMGPGGPVPLIRTFRISAIFFSGLYEYDLGYIYTTLENAQDFFSTENSVDKLGIRLENVYQVEEAEKLIKNALVGKFWITNWKEMNRQLFGALKMEKVVWFLILGFIVLIAAFNIISALIMMVMGKRDEIAIMRAIGFSSRSVMKIFMIDGFVIGMTGTFLGMIFGYAGSVFLNGLKLGVAKDVYYIDRIPVDMSVSTFVIAGLGSMVITLIATIYPGRKAAGLKPAEALRHD